MGRATSDSSDPGLRSILQALRQRILAGTYAPGERLPAIRELATAYGVAPNTVHRCLRELADAGFLSTHGRNGTRVVDHPPHRCRFGLVLPSLPDQHGDYRELNWQANAVAARSVATDPRHAVEIFHGLNGFPDLPEHRRLQDALAARRLAGLIMPSAGTVAAWLAPQRAGVPVVGVDPVARAPQIGQLFLQQEEFLQRALAAAAAHGRRRVAILLDGTPHALSLVERIREQARELGLEMPLHAIQSLDPAALGWARHVVAGLFQAPAGGGPQALILGNDAMVPAVEDALDGCGGEGTFVISMANFPLPSQHRRAALRLGWDHRAYLLRAIELISAWHDSRRPIGCEALPVIGESGLPPV